MFSTLIFNTLLPEMEKHHGETFIRLFCNNSINLLRKKRADLTVFYRKRAFYEPVELYTPPPQLTHAHRILHVLHSGPVVAMFASQLVMQEHAINTQIQTVLDGEDVLASQVFASHLPQIPSVENTCEMTSV